MNLKERLQADLATAVRTGNSNRRDALRMIIAAIKQAEVDGRTALDDAGVQSVLNRQAKQRRESIADYEKAGRPEQVSHEKVELEVIESYLPQMMSADEVKAMAAEVIAELGVTDVKGMGQVMAVLMPRLKGKADGRVVNEAVRELLQR